MRPSKSKLFQVIGLVIGIAIIPAFRLTDVPDLQEKALLPGDTELERAALEVLQTKCNVCHTRKNPRRVFTSKNMTELAPKIYQQVFIKRRMPKGKDIRLTTKEYTTLEKWLFTQDIF